jgi:hypothetical protein
VSNSWGLLGVVGGGPAMVVEALFVGSPETLDACLTDGVAAAFVFVVGVT